MADNPWDLGGGGASFKFDKIGDEVEGHLIDVIERQGTHIVTDQPEWWDKEETQPKMITLVTLRTAIRDSPNDSGLRTITLSGAKKPYPDGTKSKMCAARTALLEATGGTAFEPNAWFKMKYSRDGAPTRANFTPPKGFDAWYRSPAPKGFDLDKPVTTTTGNPVRTEPGTNWPAPTGTATTVNTSSGTVNTTTGEITGGGQPLTKAQVEGVRQLAGDDAIAVVFGADWESRVVG